MQIMINMPDEYCYVLDDYVRFYDGTIVGEILSVVKNGVPLTCSELAYRLIDKRVYGELKQDMSYTKDVIEDVKCRVDVKLIDHRSCYCGAELKEVWRDVNCN